MTAVEMRLFRSLKARAEARAVEDTGWKADGLCRSIGPDLFYSYDDSDRAEAKRVCHRCPVQPSCLEYALSFREKDGIWGGTDEKEREALIRGFHRAAAKGRAS